MALARRGSRPITVDGRGYRWRVRSKPTYSQGLNWSSLTFAVEAIGDAGSILVVSTQSPHPGNWLALPASPVLPAMVAAVIRAALRRGWQPDRPGSPFVLDLGDSGTV